MSLLRFTIDIPTGRIVKIVISDASSQLREGTILKIVYLGKKTARFLLDLSKVPYGTQIGLCIAKIRQAVEHVHENVLDTLLVDTYLQYIADLVVQSLGVKIGKKLVKTANGRTIIRYVVS